MPQQSELDPEQAGSRDALAAPKDDSAATAPYTPHLRQASQRFYRMRACVLSYRDISPLLSARRMYIVALAWIYVVFMMSITETSPVAGVMIFVFYGLLPTGVMVWLASAGRRRQRRKARETALRKTAETMADTPGEKEE